MAFGSLQRRRLGRFRQATPASEALSEIGDKEGPAGQTDRQDRQRGRLAGLAAGVKSTACIDRGMC